MKREIFKPVVAIFITLIAVTLWSCQEDFLEKPKGGTVTADEIFETKDKAKAAIALMYEQCVLGYFANDWNWSRPGAITDEVYIAHGSDDAWVGSLTNVKYYITGDMSTNTPIDRNGIGDNYKGIRQANLVIRNLPKVADADETWRNDVRGQAIFCRALQHYELFRMYGGIPLVDHPLEADEDIPRSSIERTVEMIVNWCDEATALLPATRSGADYGMATSLAARALKARVLLYAASPLYNTPPSMSAIPPRYGSAYDTLLAYPSYDVNRWKLAADASKAVIDNAPASQVALYNTGKVFTTGDTYETIGDYEATWNVDANRELILVGPPLSWRSWWNFWISGNMHNASWAVKNNVPVEFIQLYEKVDGTPWTFPQTGVDLPSFIEGLNLDPRFSQSIGWDGKFYNTSKGYLDYYLKGDTDAEGKRAKGDGLAIEPLKFMPRINNNDENHFSWPVFRLAEFYLSYAEALNEFNAGPTPEAYDAMNLVRARAGMPAKSGLNETSFRETIHRERTVEFAFENHRYNDLLRWLKATETLHEKTLHGIVTTGKKDGDKVLRNWETRQLIERKFPQRYYYVPFDNAEISKNYLGGGGDFSGQNPGW